MKKEKIRLFIKIEAKNLLDAIRKQTRIYDCLENEFGPENITKEQLKRDYKLEPFGGYSNCIHIYEEVEIGGYKKEQTN